VACIDKHTCIDKSEQKTCIKNRVVSKSKQEQVVIQQGISSREY